MVRVVYFNQWFSSIAYVIEDLKKRNKNEIKIIASSKNKDHAYKNYVDEFIVEDWEDGETTEETMKNYTDWVLDTCVKYKVDYFFVKKNAKAIMNRAVDFYMRNVLLISEDITKLNQLENKSEVYDRLKAIKSIKKHIPDYLNSSDKMEVIKYIMEHERENDIILKFNNDEGGASFRAINDDRITAESLYKFRVNEITSQEAINIAVTISNSNKLLLMEKLDSPEISVDCYNSKNGFIAICRAKEAGRRERIYYDQYIYDICKEIQTEFKLLYPFNVQFRYKHSKNEKHSKRDLRLLEINTRISGGLYYEVSEGLNIANVCLMDCMNKSSDYNIDDFINFKDKYVTHLEMPIHLDD